MRGFTVAEALIVTGVFILIAILVATAFMDRPIDCVTNAPSACRQGTEYQYNDICECLNETGEYQISWRPERRN